MLPMGWEGWNFLWSILAAPLIAGNDLRFINPQTIKILKAKEVIAVDQNCLGIQGKRISKYPNEVWARPLADGSRAVVLFNRDTKPMPIGVNWRGIWAQRDLGNFESFSRVVEPHGEFGLYSAVN